MAQHFRFASTPHDTQLMNLGSMQDAHVVTRHRLPCPCEGNCTSRYQEGQEARGWAAHKVYCSRQ